MDEDDIPRLQRCLSTGNSIEEGEGGASSGSPDYCPAVQMVPPNELRSICGAPLLAALGRDQMPNHAQERGRADNQYCLFADFTSTANLPPTSISNFQFTSASSFVRSLTWIFSSDRTALLMSRPNCAPTWPAVSLSNLALISSQLNGRVGNPG